MLSSWKIVLKVLIVVHRAMEICCFRFALIYDEGLDRHQPSSNIESWMRAAVADANRICCPASASYKTFQISNDSQLPAILDQVHTLDAMVVSVIECRIADFIEAILFPSMLLFLRLDFSRCPAITNGRETDRLEFYHLNDFNRDTCGSLAITRWLEQNICLPFVDNNATFFIMENGTSSSASRELQDCTGLDDLKWSSVTYPVTFDSPDLPDNVEWHHLLNGKHLRLTSLERPPFVIFERDSYGSVIAYKGYCYEIINALQETYNFTYEVVLPGDKSYGKIMPNGSWDGMLGLILKQDADIGLGPFSVTYSRYGVVDFSVGFHEETATILIPPPGEENRLLVCLKPFLWQVWLSLGVLVVILPVILWAHFMCLRFPHEEKTCPGLAKQYFFVLGVLIGQSGQKFVSFGYSPRLLGAVWCVSAVVFASAYVGVLVSFLRFPKLTPIINKLEELPVSHLKWVIPRGTALESLFTEATAGVYKTIGGLSDTRGSLIDSGLDGIHRVIQGSHAYIDEKSYLVSFIAEDYERSGTCRLSFAYEEFFKVSLAFPLPKNSSLKPLLDKKIMQMMEAGLGNYWKQIYWPSSGGKCGRSIQPIVGPKSLGLSDLQGAFLILAVGYGMALVICYAESRCGLANIVRSIRGDSRYLILLVSKRLGF
ncbi:probable glutamate receptor isoform X3 [Daphnia magna]|uniref:probable glutamate receptor isoform X3 n=1 Tax=Daphnia magna TaxID=35525 RepID=UPI001E1BD008|nr:probable glutamate receptor isoform X3 [Daphnia magna]